MTDSIRKIFKIAPAWITVFAIVVGVVAYKWKVPFLEIMELKTIDLRFLSRGPIRPGPEVVLVVIDEKSLAEQGKWTWPRTKMAEMINILSDSGAEVIGFDIGFLEPDRSSTIDVVDEFVRTIRRLRLHNRELERYLQKTRRNADNDLILARAIKHSKANVVLGYFFQMSKEGLEHVDENDISQHLKNIQTSQFDMVHYLSRNARDYPLIRAYMPQSNVPLIASATPLAGYFNMFPDADGTVRWIPMIIQCKGLLFPSLSLQVLRAYKEGSMLSATIAEFGVSDVRLGSLKVPTNEDGLFMINFRGGPKTFPHVSATDVLKRRVPKKTFKGKIVLIGATAIGIFDLRVTPFANIFPGLEIHANVVDNILHQDFIQRPNWAAFFDILSIIFVGVVLGLLVPRLRPVQGMAVTTLLFISYILLCQYLFTHQGAWLNIVYPMSVLVFLYVNLTIYKYITEEREKKKIRGAFSYYVTPSVVNEMLKDPEKLKLGGEKKDLTVLFSDIRGFTTISEGLTPEELVRLMNEYLTVMTDIVFKYDGLLDKYIGDAIMAVFGAPIDQNDHAARACNTALDMMEALEELRPGWEKRNIPYIDVGIGINSGPMVVGNMGSNVRFDYTVMGDSVNLGSRLEGANKIYGSHIIISEFTYSKVLGEFVCRELDMVRVKGKKKPVTIFELLGRNDTPSQVMERAELFQMGIASYKRQDWDLALKYFSRVLDIAPDDQPARLYIERCHELRANPPGKDWDGVFTMTKK
nr:CHASE2 domain-containing protein [Desulfobacterales bacterium]